MNGSLKNKVHGGCVLPNEGAVPKETILMEILKQGDSELGTQ